MKNAHTSTLWIDMESLLNRLKRHRVTIYGQAVFPMIDTRKGEKNNSDVFDELRTQLTRDTQIMSDKEASRFVESMINWMPSFGTIVLDGRHKETRSLAILNGTKRIYAILAFVTGNLTLTGCKNNDLNGRTFNSLLQPERRRFRTSTMPVYIIVDADDEWIEHYWELLHNQSE